MPMPFTREEFFNLFAAYNTTLWAPAIALWLASLVTAVWLASPCRLRNRWISGLLAVHWAWSAVAYHVAFFTRINPAAWLFAMTFLVEAALFFWLGAIRGRLVFTSPRSAWTPTGWVLIAYGLLYPGINAVEHGSLLQIPTFGLPCPTTIFTVGLLLLATPRIKVLAVVPVVWSLIGGSAALLFGMTADYGLLLAGALLTLFELQQSETSSNRLPLHNSVGRYAMLRKLLLFCGIASSLLYAAMIWTIRYEGYNPISQVPSELTAIGAPTQALWARLGWIYTVLVTAFGFGLWQSAGRSRVLRIVGGLILAYASLGSLWPFATMHQREVLAAGEGTMGDTIHLVLGAVTVVLMFLAIGFGATAYGKRFRLYSIASIVVLLAFGALTFLEAPRLQANLPTPWIGLWERINISVFLLWVVVLATLLLRAGTSQETRIVSRPSPFKTPEREARFVAAYNAAMRLWPVPYEEIEIPSRFGTAHVVASGPKTAPPLVLLHGYMATLTMWSPNIAAFSKDHRVYAIDVMGQPSKSIPADPIRNAADFVSWLTTTLDALHLERVSLVGMSFGGWLALNYAVAVPQRVQKLVLLSPGGLLPMVRQFTVRGMLMVWLPTRLAVNSFFRWLGFTDRAYESVLEMMYLGLKHFRMPLETARIMPAVVSDQALRTMKMPTLLLIGEGEVISDPAQALERARRLIPGFEGELVPGCRHDMCSSQHQIVNARVLDFLKKTGTDARGASPERSVA